MISRHLKNIFEEQELSKNSVVAKFATTAVDGKSYNTNYYNLDVIISVCYRVIRKTGVSATKEMVILQQIPGAKISLTEKSNSANRLNNISLFILKSNKIFIFVNQTKLSDQD